MKKTEMSPRQLEERTLIVSTLRAAGWQTPSNENQMFDEGLWVQREVAMEYQGPAVTMIIFYRADQEVMYVTLEMLNGRMFELKLDVDARLNDVLTTITSFQDKLTELNYKDHIRDLMKICEQIFVSTDGENFMRLIDQKNQLSDGD